MNKPPRCKRPGESTEDYRIAMGWDQPQVSRQANLASTLTLSPDNVRVFLHALQDRNEKDNGLFPQVASEVEADAKALRRVLAVLDFYHPPRTSATGADTVRQAEADLNEMRQYGSADDATEAAAHLERVRHEQAGYRTVLERIARIEIERGMDGNEAIERGIAAVGYAQQALATNGVQGTLNDQPKEPR